MHVLIGTDGSPLAVNAARRGMALLGRPDGVTLLTVLTEVPDVDEGGFGGSVYSPEEQSEQWQTEIARAHDELTRTAEGLCDGPVASRIEVAADGVASKVCEVAVELGVDVIVVGSHARSGVKRLLLGSVSEHIVRHAPCPVLVVRERNSDDGPAAGPG